MTDAALAKGEVLWNAVIFVGDRDRVSSAVELLDGWQKELSDKLPGGCQFSVKDFDEIVEGRRYKRRLTVVAADPA